MSRVHTLRLDNGLRLQLLPDERYGRVALCTTFGVGMRSETPGWEGVAHLVEHLLFEGSEQVAPGLLRRTVHDAGGIVNGTTHLDYTDYYQVVPAEMLQRALFMEADRFRAPLIAPALPQQLEVVTAEIGATARNWPHGDVPWPLLPAALQTSHGGAHNGYGDPMQLQRLTGTECREFFERHYCPSGATLTIAGPLDVDDVVKWVIETFGAIPRRALPERPNLSEPLEPRWQTWEELDAAAPVAMWGFTLPSPMEDPAAYAAFMVLRELVAHDRPTNAELGVSASCGYFGPLDAREPDTFVITAAGAGCDAGGAPRVLSDLLGTLGGIGDEQVEAASRSTAARLSMDREALLFQVRELSRCDVLFGDRDLGSRIAEQARHTGADDVRRAVATLMAQPIRGASLVPSSRRTRPVDTPVQRGPARLDLVEPVARTASLPAVGPRRPPPKSTVAHERREGLDVAAVRDTRSDRVHVALRIDVSDPGWMAPPEVLLRTSSALEAAMRVRLGRRGDVTVTTDGQWVDVDLICSPEFLLEDTRSVTEALEDLAMNGEGETALSQTAPKSHWTSGHVVAQALRLRWGHLPVLPPTLQTVARGVLGGRTTAVVIGAVDPGFVALELADIMGSRALANDVEQQDTAGYQPLMAAGLRQVDVAVAFPECGPAGGAEARRFLASAVAAGYRGSRLGQRVKTRGDGYAFTSSRELVRTRHASVIRTAVAPHRLHDFAEDIGWLRADLDLNPVTAAEVERARGYCIRQSTVLFDSPAILAGGLRAMTARGCPVRWPWELASHLSRVSVAEMRNGVQDLFAAAPTILALGPVPEAARDWFCQLLPTGGHHV